MIPRPYVFLALLTMLVALACGGEDDPPPSTVPAATDTEAPVTTPSVQVHPSGTRTGRPSIDPVLEAVERLDAAKLSALLSFVTRPCSTQQGFAIICRSGEPEGTMVDVIAYGQCEPSLSQIVFRNAAGAAVTAFIGSRPSGLVAVTQAGVSPYHALYGISYASGHVVLLDDDGVTGFLPPCPGVPAGPRPVGERHILAPP
jgi:hypothetical protein